MQDDKNDIDDFDSFDDVEDFDDIELGDDISYDDDDDLSEFDDLNEDEVEITDDTVDESLIAKEKKDSIFSKFSFNQIVIAGAVVVGAGFFLFQLATTPPPARQEQFQSAVNMSGSNDNMVFGDTQQIDATNTQDTQTNTQGGLLNNSELLDSLEIDFEEDVPMPVPISREGQLDDEDILMQNAQNNSARNTNVDIAEEFQTVPRAPEMNIPSGFEGEVFGEIEQPQQIQQEQTNFVESDNIIQNDELKNTEMVDVNLQPLPTPSLNIPQETNVNEITEDKDSDVFPQANPIVTTDVGTERIEAQPLNKTKNAQILEETPVIINDPPQIVTLQESNNNPTIEKVALLENQIEEITLQKDRRISQLNKTVNNLQNKLDEMETKLETMQATANNPVKTAVKAEPVKQTAAPKAKSQSKQSVKEPSRPKTTSVQWELRAAQPGKAWVSQKGREDLQPIVIGDTLSGLGRITAISFNNNRWIVTGQNGSIKQ